MLTEVLFILMTYFLGAIPFGYLFTKWFTGKNILDLGSKSIGSTNVGRIAGKKIATFTQICDMLKGLLPVSTIFLLQKNNITSFADYYIYLIALASIMGHNFSIFLKFKGGKGVNTTLGASILLAPLQVLIVKWQTNYVSLGSICLGISLPLTGLLFPVSSFCFYYLLTVSLLIIIMHSPNIGRLIKGKENRLE